MINIKFSGENKDDLKNWVVHIPYFAEQYGVNTMALAKVCHAGDALTVAIQYKIMHKETANWDG